MNRKNSVSIVVLLIVAVALAIGGAVYFKAYDRLPTSSNLITAAEATTSTVSKHPWPQFHGSALHTGYAAVVGPKKATLKWKVQLGTMKGGDPNSVAIASDGTIYVAGAATIFALDKNGKKIWSKSYQGTQGPTLAEDGTIYVLAQDTVVALEKNGTEKWKYKTGGNTGFGPTIGPDGTIYQGSWDGYFYAINKNGTLKWKYKTAGAISYPASIDRNGTIYLGGGDAHAGPDRYLYAFKSDGTLRWKYDTKAMRVGSPAIGSDGLIYAPASPNLIVLDASGKLKWKKNSVASLDQTPVAYAAECGAPPLPACGGVQPQNGYIPQASDGCGAPPLPPCSGVQGGDSFQSLPQSKDDLAGIITPALSSDGTIYIGNSQGVLSAVNPKTQKVTWTYQTGVDPAQPGFYGLPSFPLVDKNGTVYIGSVDGNMYAVRKDGTLVWKYQTGGKITEASPAFGSDGVLYFTSLDGYLYAIGS